MSSLSQISARFSVLSHEDQPEFEELLRALTDEYAPETTNQRLLVTQIAQFSWKMQRIDRLETLALDLISFGQETTGDGPDTRMVASMSKDGRDAIEARRDIQREQKEAPRAMDAEINEAIRLPVSSHAHPGPNWVRFADASRHAPHRSQRPVSGPPNPLMLRLLGSLSISGKWNHHEFAFSNFPQ